MAFTIRSSIETWNCVQLLLSTRNAPPRRTAGARLAAFSRASCSMIAWMSEPRGQAGSTGTTFPSDLAGDGNTKPGSVVARVPALEIEARVARRRARPRPLPSNRDGGHEPHQPKASGRQPILQRPPGDYDATSSAAIERVVMSRTTIEIETPGDWH